MSELEEMLKKLYGLPPYDNWSNICYGDGYFAKSIEDKFSKEEIKQAKKKLKFFKNLKSQNNFLEVPYGIQQYLQKWQTRLLLHHDRKQRTPVRSAVLHCNRHRPQKAREYNLYGSSSKLR